MELSNLEGCPHPKRFLTIQLHFVQLHPKYAQHHTQQRLFLTYSFLSHLCPAEEQRFVSNYFVAFAAGMAGSRQVSDDSAALGAAGPKACTAPHASAPVPDVQLPAHPLPS